MGDASALRVHSPSCSIFADFGHGGSSRQTYLVIFISARDANSHRAHALCGRKSARILVGDTQASGPKRVANASRLQSEDGLWLFVPDFCDFRKPATDRNDHHEVAWASNGVQSLRLLSACWNGQSKANAAAPSNGASSCIKTLTGVWARNGDMGPRS